MSRWIRTQADFLDHAIFKDEPFTEREAWFWLIANAAWKDTSHRVQSKVFKVVRGSLFTTVRQLMKRWQWGAGRVTRFLDLLEGQNMIERKNGTGKTHVTICNYNKFQDQKEKSEQERNTDRYKDGTVAEQERNTKGTNNTNTTKEKSEPKASPKRGGRLPDSWTAGEQLISFSKAEGLTTDRIHREISKFRDYWHSKAGAAATKLDWDLTFKNWIRRVAEEKPQGFQPVSPGSKFRQMAAEQREMGN